MSRKDVRASCEHVIKAFYDALIAQDVGSLTLFCTEDATLNWAHYTFKGRKEVENWVTEWGQHFFEVTVDHTYMAWEKDWIVHRFNLKIRTSKGQRGWIPGVGKYEFKDGKLHHLWITPLHGRGNVLITKKDLI